LVTEALYWLEIERVVPQQNRAVLAAIQTARLTPPLRARDDLSSRLNRDTHTTANRPAADVYRQSILGGLINDYA
jgi:hypothetical protein